MPYENNKAYNHSIHNRAGSYACRNSIIMSIATVYLLTTIGFFAGILFERFLGKKVTKIVHHVSAGGEIELFQRLDLLTTKIDAIMTVQERLEKAIADLNEGTNEIAADLQALKDQIAAGTVSPESMAKLEENIQILQQLGQQQ